MNTPFQIKRVGKIIANFCWFLGAYAFWVILFLIFLDILAGAIFFYNYEIKAKNAVNNNTKAVILFNDKSYQDIISAWQERQKEFDKPSPVISNPF
ncbi:MAG: hypothetical protein NTV36_02325 [Candidatus Staskawiczbacteria bacterium]|nr:hypothetical protein [Candidatus Staskawiczbacteria bacterium]